MEEEGRCRVVYSGDAGRSPVGKCYWFNLFLLGASGPVPHCEEGSSGENVRAAKPAPRGCFRQHKGGASADTCAGVHGVHGCFHATKAQ